MVSKESVLSRNWPFFCHLGINLTPKEAFVSVSVLKQKTHNSCSIPEYEKGKQQQSVREDMMSNGNELLFILETK